MSPFKEFPKNTFPFFYPFSTWFRGHVSLQLECASFNGINVTEQSDLRTPWPYGLQITGDLRNGWLCFKDDVFLPFESTFVSTSQLVWWLTPEFMFYLFTFNLAQRKENRIYSVENSVLLDQRLANCSLWAKQIQPTHHP